MTGFFCCSIFEYIFLTLQKTQKLFYLSITIFFYLRHCYHSGQNIYDSFPLERNDWSLFHAFIFKPLIVAFTYVLQRKCMYDRSESHPGCKNAALKSCGVESQIEWQKQKMWHREYGFCITSLFHASKKWWFNMCKLSSLKQVLQKWYCRVVNDITHLKA